MSKGNDSTQSRTSIGKGQTVVRAYPIDKSSAPAAKAR
jgi:hypothetical protein